VAAIQNSFGGPAPFLITGLPGMRLADSDYTAAKAMVNTSRGISVESLLTNGHCEAAMARADAVLSAPSNAAGDRFGLGSRRILKLDTLARRSE